MKKLLLPLLILAFSTTVLAQKKNPWTTYTGTRPYPTDKAVTRMSFPNDFKLFNLDMSEIRSQLFEVVGNAVSHTSVITLPNADGGFEQFEILEASNFEPGLQARFPEIRAFSGKGLTDKYATVKISYSPQGIQTSVFRADRPNEFMEPYSLDHKIYAVFASQRNIRQLPWVCHTPDEQMEQSINTRVQNMQVAARSGGDLKTMRLAQSCNGEYANYFGATGPSQVALVLAAFNATLTRCNGVYEKDLAIHLNLIDSTTRVIYYNPSTDPYTTLSSWNSQLQSALTSQIGEANYDIGHMFGASGGGGNAGCIGCICVNGSKGSGITSPADGIPQGDNFDIDYVVHEVGHQMGANHTFSHSNEGTGVNKEPGSGITIMGYAGITSQDMAPHSIDIFHQASIAQIQSNLASKTCPVTSSIAAANVGPVVSALTNYTIPISTPFALTGSATDANGDPLTYCWEQNDNASSTQTGSNSIASATKATGPNWISFPPSASPVRYFPRLSTILAGGLISGPLPGGDASANSEALSSVSRTLNFRLTVRDNAPYSSTSPFEVGQTQFTDMVVTVSNTSGPFNVTAPNTAVSWSAGSTQTITWNVANTTATPVACANVRISLSTDGGNTFPFVLASSTPNDGSEAIVIPAVATTAARIMVEAVGNIFFDISNANFTILNNSLCGIPSGLASSNIGNDSVTLSWNAVSGALSYDVDFKVSTAGTWTSAAVAQSTTVLKLTGLSQGTLYDWRVRTNCSAGSGNYSSAQFTTTAPFVCNAPTNLAASSITSTSATLGWGTVSGASTYSVEYKADTSATWIVLNAAASGTTASLTGLKAGTLYNFRVRTNCTDGSSSAFASANFTTVAVSACELAFEPNQSISAATSIVSGTTYSAAIANTTDSDFFKITTTATSNITYNLVGPSGVDFDMTIYNASGTQIATGNGSTATETISLTNQAAGTYYIQVFGYQGAFSSTCYTLRATATTVTSCANALDNSTNGTLTGAAVIPFNTNVTGLINASGDVDNYRFNITRGGTITISLTTLPANFNLRLVNSAGTILVTSQQSGTSNESISTTVSAGTYYARVYGSTTSTFNATSCYTLRVALGTAARSENYVTLGANAPDMRVYPVPVKDILNIELNDFASSTEIEIYDIKGTRMSRNRISGKNAKLDLSQLPSGMYIIKCLNGKSTVARAKFIKE